MQGGGRAGGSFSQIRLVEEPPETARYRLHDILL
jgi:hypothetical protein